MHNFQNRYFKSVLLSLHTYSLHTYPEYHLLDTAKNSGSYNYSKSVQQAILVKLKNTILISTLSAISLVNYYLYQANYQQMNNSSSKKVLIEPTQLESWLSVISQKCRIPNLNQHQINSTADST